MPELPEVEITTRESEQFTRSDPAEKRSPAHCAVSIRNRADECSDFIRRHGATLPRGAGRVQPRVVCSNADSVGGIGLEQFHVDGITQPDPPFVTRCIYRFGPRP